MVAVLVPLGGRCPGCRRDYVVMVVFQLVYVSRITVTSET